MAACGRTLATFFDNVERTVIEAHRLVSSTINDLQRRSSTMPLVTVTPPSDRQHRRIRTFLASVGERYGRIDEEDVMMALRIQPRTDKLYQAFSCPRLVKSYVRPQRTDAFERFIRHSFPSFVRMRDFCAFNTGGYDIGVEGLVDVSRGFLYVSQRIASPSFQRDVLRLRHKMTTGVAADDECDVSAAYIRRSLKLFTTKPPP